MKSVQTGIIGIAIDGLCIDLIAHRATKAGKEIKLTEREFALLRVLMEVSPGMIDKSTLYRHVWGENIKDPTNVVNVYIRHLRKKIVGPGQTPTIRTTRNKGFALISF